MLRIIILLVVSLAGILFLFFQVSGHFKQDEKEQLKTMNKQQKRGYYFTLFGVVFISILLLYALIIAVLLIFNYQSNLSTEGGLFKLLGTLFFHSLSVNIFISLIGYNIIINCILLWIILRFSSPIRLLKNPETTAMISIGLGILLLLLLRTLNDPLVYGTEIAFILSETSVLGAFSEAYDDSIFRPIFIILNLVGPLLIVVGGIILNISHKRKRTKH